MKKISLMAAALVAASTFGFASTAAQAAYAIVAPDAPPPPRVETVPAPRAGRTWVEGHWAYRDGEYAWVPGHWMTARRNMEWVQGHWVQRDGEWAWVEGHWRRGRALGWRDRDNDGDGVANYNDRYPNDPTRS
jgi:hypothetical protein